MEKLKEAERNYEEIKTLQDRLLSIYNKSKAVVLLEGPAGVGKTWLMNCMARRSRQEDINAVVFHYNILQGGWSINRYTATFMHLLLKESWQRKSLSEMKPPPFGGNGKEWFRDLCEKLKDSAADGRLLFIFDGLEWVEESKNSVVDFIEEIDELEDDVYLIYTAREGEVKKEVLEKLISMDGVERIRMSVEEVEDYEDALRRYMEKRGVKGEAADEILRRAGKRFLYVSHYVDVLGQAYKRIEDLPEKPEKFYESYIEKLKQELPYRWKKYMRLLAWSVLAVRMDGIEIKALRELGFLGEELLDILNDLRTFLLHNRAENTIKVAHDDLRLYMEKRPDFKDYLESYLKNLHKAVKVYAEEYWEKEEPKVLEEFAFRSGLLKPTAFLHLFLDKELKSAREIMEDEQLGKFLLGVSAFLREGKKYEYLYELADTICAIYKWLVEEQKKEELRDGLAEAYMNRGLTKDELWLFSHSLEDFNIAIEIMESLFQQEKHWIDHLAEAYFRRGNSNFAESRYSEALEDYSKAIKIMKKLLRKGKRGIGEELVTAYIYRGRVKYELSRYKKAKRDFNKALKLIKKLLQEEEKPSLRENLAIAYLNKGLCETELHHYRKASKDFLRAISILNFFRKEKKMRMLLAQAYINKGKVEYALNHYQKALVNYNKAIEIMEEMQDEEKKIALELSETYRNKALALKKLKRWEEFLDFLEKSILVLENTDRKIFESQLYKRNLTYAAFCFWAYRAWSNKPSLMNLAEEHLLRSVLHSFPFIAGAGEETVRLVNLVVDELLPGMMEFFLSSGAYKKVFSLLILIPPFSSSLIEKNFEAKKQSLDELVLKTLKQLFEQPDFPVEEFKDQLLELAKLYAELNPEIKELIEKHRVKNFV